MVPVDGDHRYILVSLIDDGYSLGAVLKLMGLLSRRVVSRAVQYHVTQDLDEEVRIVTVDVVGAGQPGESLPGLPRGLAGSIPLARSYGPWADQDQAVSRPSDVGQG